ncbi:MAG TPA: 50S ribosomal protein L11 methyltransferase [Rhodanobacteraceae bacterium]|nr:50S ribosomal protein L11 methyltransferase [Rhodanobacteraceae bacterium]
MPWLELTLTVDHQQEPAAEAALEALDALSITLADALAETPDEQAIFEPGVGDTPLWPHVVLQALFPADAERAALADALARKVPGIAPQQIDFREIADQDWERAWMDQFKPMRFGRRLWVYPWTIEPPEGDGAVVVRLDPGLAFGTGTHPTTALCLRWLDSLDLRDQTLVDYGCGSGVLAIAALKLGAARAVGVDNDPQALTASRSNAERNGVSAWLELYPPAAAPTVAADVFVANILAGPLLELAPRLAQQCVPGAYFALSGILESQREELLARYEPWFEQLQATGEDGWMRIDGRRRR